MILLTFTVGIISGLMMAQGLIMIIDGEKTVGLFLMLLGVGIFTAIIALTTSL